MGKILDIYFCFAAGDDYYLGQLLSLKDPMHADFNLPHPHWKDPDDPIIFEGINLTFGKIFINKLEEIAMSIKEDVGNVVVVLEEAVSNAIDKKVKVDGCINSSILDERLKNLQDLLMKWLDEVCNIGGSPVEPEVAITGDQIDILQRRNTFYYRGTFCCVPESLHSLSKLLI